MGTSENTRRRLGRWQVMELVMVMVVLVGSGLCQVVPSQSPCPEGATPHSLEQPVYEESVRPVGDFMASFVQSFLNTVQPKPFPKVFHTKVLVYGTGFLVCVAIGVLYIVLMPIVGLFLACCRCCGNCGGKMQQKQTSSIHCRRRALYSATFVTTVIILCVFGSQRHDNSLNLWLPVFINTHFYVTIEEVTKNLDGENSYKLFCLLRFVVNTSALLKKLNTSLNNLESNASTIQIEITNVKNEINETLSKPDCTNCENMKPELNKLTVDTSIDSVTNLDLLKVVNIFKMKYVRFIIICVVAGSKAELAKIKSQISNISTDLPLSSLNDVLTQLENFQANISTYSPEVERVEYIRWCVCITLCCVILLVVVCNVFGLALGPLGLKSKVEPTKRSCTSDCGGTFFMMGAGFSFLISWLFMILVLILFLIGANAYTLLCKPWRNGELLQLLDTPGVIPGFNPSATFGANITISSIYRYVIVINILIHLTILYLTILFFLIIITEIVKKISLHEVKDQLKSFASKSGNIDFSTTVQEVQGTGKMMQNNYCGKSTLYSHLLLFQTGQIKMELKNEAQKLRKIQADIETVIFPQLVNFPTRLTHNTSNLYLCIFQKCSELTLCRVTLLFQESGQFLDCQLGYFTAFADWARNMITQELGRCGPVAGAVDSADIIICSNMVESLNAFWFSLGWCMIFLIPSIIFSIKLAKYYRRMKYNDVFE
uniref:Prominin 2 n=1 Tax=Periophthalmus magnuspinnatus TaxID=409849 RepID=A0A3B4B679_9GOBI